MRHAATLFLVAVLGKREPMDIAVNEYSQTVEQLEGIEFPYDKCIICKMRNAKRCDGPNPFGLGSESVSQSIRRVDFLRKLQNYNKETRRNGANWSYDYIAAQTNGVSKTTVIRIITEPDYDPGTYAYSEVFRVLFDSSRGKYPCGIHSEEKEVVYVDSPETLRDLERIQQENSSLLADLSQLRANIGRTHDFQEKELQTVREEAGKLLAETKAKHAREIAHLQDQIMYLRGVNDHNKKVIDKLMER